VALGFALLAVSLAWFREFPDVARFLACLSLACIASTMKVRLPGLQGTISVNFVFIFMGIAELSLAETLTLSLAATVVQCLWRPKTRPKFIRVLFNASAVSISTVLAYWTAHSIPCEPHELAALAPAVAVFFVANIGMVSLAMALTSNTPLRMVWAQFHLWTFPYFLAGAVLAGAISASSHAVGWRVSLLALPVMYLVYSYYDVYVSSQVARHQAY